MRFVKKKPSSRQLSFRIGHDSCVVVEYKSVLQSFIVNSSITTKLYFRVDFFFETAAEAATLIWKKKIDGFVYISNPEGAFFMYTHGGGGLDSLVLDPRIHPNGTTGKERVFFFLRTPSGKKMEKDIDGIFLLR